MKRRKRILSYLLCLVLLVFLFPISVFASESDPENPEKPVYEEKLYSNATIEDSFDGSSVLVVMDKAVGGINKVHEKEFFGDFPIEEIVDLTYITGNIHDKGIDEEAFRQILQIKLPEDSKENVLWVMRQLELVEGIRSAEPDYIWDDPFASTTPNDPGFVSGYQWGLTKIQAPSAWDFTTGSKSVRVGVIDSGISASHPDLLANVTSGWDFYNNNNVTGDDPTGHGTQVAGVIGAVGNNGTGISGVCWNVILVPLQVIYKEPLTGLYKSKTTYAASAVVYATNNSIPILNCSLGFSDDNLTFKQAINNYPGLFVCAAGNDGTSNGGSNPYPSVYNYPNIISVANTTNTDSLNPSSNYSSTTVHLAAPGTDIYTTTLNSSYTYVTGTSFSAPFVAGVAALILSANPLLSATQIKDCILSTVDQVAALQNKTITGGRLNAYKAVQKAKLYFIGWQMINWEMYYFDTNGQMLLGWQTISGYQYYFRPSANYPSTGSQGSLATGWQSITGSKYYFNNNGCMLTGWQTISGQQYYFNANGQMLFGWQKIGGYWYFFDSINGTGVMATGWLFYDNSWFYLRASTNYPSTGPKGSMVMDWQWVKDGNGTEYWFYFKTADSGRMVTSRAVQDSGGWCFLQSNGRAALNANVSVPGLSGTRYVDYNYHLSLSPADITAIIAYNAQHPY